MPEREDQKRDDQQIAELRAEVQRLTALVRTVDLFGTGFVWTDPVTGTQRLLHPADVSVILRADQQTEIEKIREAAYRAGREDAARNALIIRGDLDITTVVAALDRAGFDCPDDALRNASADLLRRLPVWQGSDGMYRPRIPKADQPGVQPTEEQRADE